MPAVIELWSPGSQPSPHDVESLAALLHDTVHAGASVSFILPFSFPEARAFWLDDVFPHVHTGATRLLIARQEHGGIAGTVLLDLCWQPNQRHRAEVKKLLVHPQARRRGIGRSLMLAVEEAARAESRTLLTLDTRTGDHAEPLYLSLGYIAAGVIPRFARAPKSPDLESTTFLYKELS
jgi:GNAT superfamily N-acetyltransferase